MWGIKQNKGKISTSFNTIGDAAKYIVGQELAKLGYKDIEAITSFNGQGIDVVARSSNGSIMIFAARGSTTTQFNSLPSSHVDSEGFLLRILSNTKNPNKVGFRVGARASAEAILLACGYNAPFFAIRVNVSMGPIGVASRPTMSFVHWN